MDFWGKFRKNPNLHQVDNTTMGIKCKYLFWFFVYSFGISLPDGSVSNRRTKVYGRIAFAKNFLFLY